MAFSCIVLCGGKSKRMGKNKAFIEINNTFIVDIIIEQLKKISENIILVVDKKEKYAQIDRYESVRILEDENRNIGPVEGMRIGLKAMKDKNAFICACDMPLLAVDCIMELYSCVKEDVNCVIPKINGKMHPLHGFYSKNIVSMLEEMSKRGIKQIRYLFDNTETKFIETFSCDIERSVTNMNNPDDLEKIKGRGVIYE